MNTTELFFVGLAIVGFIGLIATLIYDRQFTKRHSPPKPKPFHISQRMS